MDAVTIYSKLIHLDMLMIVAVNVKYNLLIMEQIKCKNISESEI